MPTTRLNDIDVYYEEHGDPNAEPVLLIMGFVMNASAWGPQIDALKPRYHVIAFDNRGAGRTTQPGGAYTVPQLAADAAALLDHLGITSAHIVGASLGGMIAQEFALRYPARVRTLTLLCTTAGGSHSPGFDALTERAKELLDLTEMAPVTPERVQEFALELFTPEFLKAPGPGFMAMVVETAQHPSTLAGAQGQMRAILGHDTYDRLPQIAAPTLVMAGADDVMVDAANAPILAERIPGAQLRIYPGLRHGFNAEQPELVNAEIMAFLARHATVAA